MELLNWIDTSNGFWSFWHQAIVGTNDGSQLEPTLGTNFSKICMKILYVLSSKILKSCPSDPFQALTHSGPVIPYEAIDLGQHWLR